MEEFSVHISKNLQPLVLYTQNIFSKEDLTNEIPAFIQSPVADIFVLFDVLIIARSYYM